MSSYQALRDALASVDRDECDFDEFADAANPATIAALLAERDALQAALDAVKRESLKVVTQIQAERDALAKDAARWRWGVKHAAWYRREERAHIAIPVAADADLSCVATRVHAIDSAMRAARKDAT